ncbi:MAG: OmpA family protein [Granulosicoccus sp.]
MNRGTMARRRNRRRSSKFPKVLGIPLATAALVSISLAGLVFAQEERTPEFKKRIYLGGGIGLTRIEPESPSDALTVSDNSDTGAHLAVGYDINRFFTIEGYAADLGTAQIAFLGADVGTIDYTVYGISALGYLYNTQSGFAFDDTDTDGLFRREGLSLYGRAGLGQMSNSATGVQYFRDHSTHAAFGVGLEYGFKNGFALRTELMAIDTDAKYLNIGILKRFGNTYVAPKEKPPVYDPPVDGQEKPPIPELPKPSFNSSGNFEFDRSDISAEFGRNLDVLAAVLLKNDVGIVINGHTDSTGSERYNQGLSERRAVAVARYLQSKGVSSSRLQTRGFGETQPLTDNSTPYNRSLNRRVEIDIQ